MLRLVVKIFNKLKENINFRTICTKITVKSVQNVRKTQISCFLIPLLRQKKQFNKNCKLNV